MALPRITICRITTSSASIAPLLGARGFRSDAALDAIAKACEEKLLGINSANIIAKGNVNISSYQNAASKLLDKVFKVHLGRGLYGECLGVRADGNSNLSGEIGKQLSVKSAAAGLRPIGAVIYMQRNNLKMCLRSTDSATDTSEIAKAYGGGGSPSASSFIIRMDEFNQWRSVNAC